MQDIKQLGSRQHSKYSRDRDSREEKNGPECLAYFRIRPLMFLI